MFSVMTTSKLVVATLESDARALPFRKIQSYRSGPTEPPTDDYKKLYNRIVRCNVEMFF